LAGSLRAGEKNPQKAPEGEENAPKRTDGIEEKKGNVRKS